MANVILAEHTAAVEMTIDLDALASSEAGVGRQSTIVSNTNNAQIIHLFVQILTGTTPAIDTNIFVYLIKSDGTHRSDGAGASDAGITIVNAPLLGVIRMNSASTGQEFHGEFTIYNPGIEWGIAIVQDTVATLGAGSAMRVAYVVENQEVQ